MYRMGEGMKKVNKKALAAVLALTVLVSATYAWQSFSQSVINETAGVDDNVGARLHNDFNGENADIYVENYASLGGTTTYTRVRVQEYFEYGNTAGTLTNNVGDSSYDSTNPRDEDQLTILSAHISNATPSIDDRESWGIHLFGDSLQSEISEFVEINTGSTTNANNGSKIYMPTFMKNMDKIDADIKGSLAGSNGLRYDGDSYSDYKEYTIGEKVTGIAEYSEEAEAAITEGTNLIEETHEAVSTIEGDVISMDDWIDAGSVAGDYWVYDEDGWIYWANGLAPQTATSLLVDSIRMVKTPDVDYHYGLHVVMQAATAEDLGDVNAQTGMYEDITGDGAKLLDIITAPVKHQQGEILEKDGIEWIVLDVNEDKTAAMLMANEPVGPKYAMNNLDQEDISYTWANCQMRAYLNSDKFIDTYLPELKADILKTTVTTKLMQSSTQTVVTEDKVFLLTIEDLGWEGNITNNTARTNPNPLVPEEYVSLDETYITRSQRTSVIGYYVNNLGRNYDSGAHEEYAVRPVLWIAM